MVVVSPSGVLTIALPAATLTNSPGLSGPSRRTTRVPRRTACSSNRTRSGRCSSKTSPNRRLHRRSSTWRLRSARRTRSSTWSRKTSSSLAMLFQRSPRFRGTPCNVTPQALIWSGCSTRRSFIGKSLMLWVSKMAPCARAVPATSASGVWMVVPRRAQSAW